MPRSIKRPAQPPHNHSPKRELAPRGSRLNHPGRTTHERLALEPLEDRTLLAADLSASLAAAQLVAPLTPFSAAQLSGLDLARVTSQGRDVAAFAGDWIVQLDKAPGDSPATSLAAATKLFGQRVKGLQSVRGLASNDTFLIHTSRDYSLAGLSKVLASLGVAQIEPNFLAWKDDTIPNDPSFPDQWALENTGQSGGVIDADIDAPLAWDVNTGSGQTVVGIIDSGVDYNHPDLNDNMWHNPGEIPGDGIDNDGNGFVDDVYGYDFLNGDSDPLDDEGHGTSVAGIIAGEGNNNLGVSGVNWNAQIMALKIFDPVGFAGTAQIVGAINYATMMKRDYGINVIATNNSWGTVGYSTVLYDAVADAGLADILLVASAGNSQHDNDVAPQFPAGFDLDNVISVAATDRSDHAASFTSFGETTVDLGAPGVSTRTTALGGGYRNFSGTSASAPYVTGVAALVYDTYPKASALQVKQAILDGVDPIPAMAGITVTGGRLNVRGALEAMPMQVVAASPDEGDVVSSAPVDFTIETAFAIDPGTLDASDLTVGGVPADSVLASGRTATFSFNSSPVTSPGPQELRIEAGAFARQLNGSPVQEFVATFFYDPSPLQVIGTNPSPGMIAPWPVASLEVQFNETVDPSSVGPGDLLLSEGGVSGVSVVGDTIIFQLAGIASDRRLTASLAAGAVADSFGNPNAAFSTTLDVDATMVLAAPFERLEPLGGLIFASRSAGRLTDAADTDRFDFFLEAGQTVSVRVTPLSPSASLSVELLGIAGPAGSPGAGQPATLSPTRIATSGMLSIEVGGNAATDYRVEIFRNAAVEEPTSAVGQDIAASAIEIGSQRYGVVGSIAPGQTDRYTLDLTVGQPVDVVLSGQQGVSLTGATLELIAPGGAVVAAVADPLGNGATNYDLAMLDYIPGEIGTYELRLTSPAAGAYAIVVTEGLQFESEVNDGPLGVVRSVDGASSVAGFVDPLGHLGPFEFTVDALQSFLNISGGVGDPNVGVLAAFQEQAPGSLHSDLSGTISAIVSAGSIQLLPQASILAMEKPGSFQPGNAPADFAASLNVPPFIVGGALALRNTSFGLITAGLALNGGGNFAADELSFALKSSLSIIVPGALSENVEFEGTFTDNEALAAASLQLVDGQWQLTLPISVTILIPVPQLPLAGIFHLAGQVLATATAPGTDDFYSVTLAPGESLNVATRTPFDLPGSTPGNPLDAALALVDAMGNVVASDADSAPDGRNAILQYTSAAGGTYHIQVLHTAGRGEYVLDVDKNMPPKLEPIGDKVVAEGSKLQFTAQATDPNLDGVTYSLGSGAPAGASIHPTSGKFTWKPADDTGGPFPITVIVTDNGNPQRTDSETFLVTVNNRVPKIKKVELTPSTPAQGEQVSLAVTFKDAGILDAHTVIVHWGDGSSGPANVTPTAQAGKYVARANHVYSDGGTHEVSFTITDDDGGAAVGSRSVIVTGMGVHELDGRTVLEIVGTPGHDYITVTPTWGNRILVYASFLQPSTRMLPLGGIDLIRVLGLAGNDTISINSSWFGPDLPALVDGGDGNDTIRGGNGGNVLLGGGGNDLIYGGSRRDILIGGLGVDSLFGNGDEDILIGGYTSYDTPAGQDRHDNDRALLALLDEWSSRRSYATRTANISTGTGPILGGSGYSLTGELTVFDDSQRDLLYGGAYLDWYFGDSRDLVFRTSGEKLNS